MNSKTAYSPEVCPHNMPNIRPNKQTNKPPKNERSFNKWEHVWTSLIKKQNNLRIAANKLTKCTTTTLQNSICVCNSTLWYEWRFKNAFYVLVSHVFIWSSSLTNKYILQFSSRLTEIIKPPYVSIMKSWKGVSELETCIYPRTSESIKKSVIYHFQEEVVKISIFPPICLR